MAWTANRKACSRLPLREWGHFCMVPQRHARCPEGTRRALSSCSTGYKADQTVLMPLRRRKRRTTGEEITRLLAADFIMEVFHSEWLANPMLVLKKNKTWRMCVDYTSL